MDFGIGFLSNNVMLPIIDFFYGIFPSYGLAIVALTLIVRFALYPLSAGSIRNMRKMRIVQPLMQKRMAEIKERFKDDPQKQQEEMVNVQKEFGNPLAGCFPLLIQMPVLLALFATLRGSPFAGVNYSVNLQIFPAEQIEQIQPQAFATPPQNIYIADGEHVKVTAILPSGNKLAVGEQTKIQYQTLEGKPFQVLLAEHPDTKLIPEWKITKGEDKVKIDTQGNLEALQPGEVTIQGTIPGLAADKGFLFIDALGRVGAQDPDGTIHWDIVAMIVFFGISLYVSQMLSGQNSSGGNPNQDTVNKITPVIFSGMFLFFPLPAGVLMYMVIGNIFQTLQTYILSREPLPEELQKIVDAQDKEAAKEQKVLPFEPTSSKKTEATSSKKTEPASSKKTEPASSKKTEPKSSKKKATGGS
ncbi:MULTISPECIES: membrane protein insertase YidC [Nostoc]|jgi:YidC/Oxa1 family membrane protein insertase|uniref:Membrane protein insertase YidC n=1 Tax=Nostoc punctiforme FACHB-252 TaxID=1357509 RepID=A0ABR8HFU1_NOSPU|nr:MULTISPECIES: membrane protein insertase YidC [Nostoc]MBC1240278.1 membrane protein insertase YidC [Nostoc sp. 2RC]MBD2614189.1 membrane protein insertase YidC [Nostoc punctiforme FACHB-252]MBL1197581.1 membrane protein insertase YidC [Nostoc sp. GBBB01]MDZ8015014.1 membrane protein insertase YidC [Nostoc sp. ZfuVER08]